MRKIDCCNIPMLVACISVLAGCAGGGDSASTSDTTSTAVTIGVQRNAKASTGDCAVTVTIANRTNVAWDAVSYNLALQDKRGVFAGRVMGAPRTKVKPGETLTDRSLVTGARCENIAGAAPVYFGYYPSGKRQVTVHNANVRVRLE